MANRRHLPAVAYPVSADVAKEHSWTRDSLNDTDHLRFCLMVDEVIDLVVAVDQGPSVPRLRLGISQECHGLIEMGDIPYRGVCFDIRCLSLRGRDCTKRFELAIVESCRFAIAGEVD